MDARKSDSPGPPRIAERILRVLYSDRHDFTHLGDFREVYLEIRSSRGPFAAGLWYMGQILRSVPGFLFARFYWSAVMFRNYFIISLRHMIRERGSSLISLTGLAAGMACFLLIFTYVRFETGFDRFHQNADRIYRVLTESMGRGAGYYTDTSDLLAPALLSHIPGIIRATIIYPDYGESVLECGERRFYQKGLFVEASFLDMFSFPMISGNKKTALSHPSSIVLTESTTHKLFGRENPIGKVIGRKNTGGRRDLVVTGVMCDVPPNSHLQFDYLVSLETLRSSISDSNMFGSWDICYFTTYIELAEGQSREAAESLIPAMMTEVASDKDRSFMKFSFQPLRDIHLRSKFISGDPSGGDIRYVHLFLTIAFLILLIACVNHINLATAQAAVRIREIGIRKVNGACRTHVFQQFLGESFFIASLAGGMALFLIVLITARFDNLFGIPIQLQFLRPDGLWPWLVATVVFVSLCAGVYPALLLSGLQPVRALREPTWSGKKGTFLRSFLVVFQFTSSVVLIMATIVVFNQMRYVKSERLGYNREHVVIIPAREKKTMEKLPVIKWALEERPEVVKASLCSSLPTGLRIKYYGIDMTKDDGTNIKLDFDAGYVDENFLDVFEIGLVSGRNFRAGDKNVMLINEAALNELGWKEPIGKKFRGGQNEIIGVIRDFQNGSLHNKIGPMTLFYGSGRGQIAVRVRPGDPAKTIGVLRSVFEQNSLGQPFDFYFLNDAYNGLYRKEMRTGEIFGVFAGLAVLIACLGLFGLTAFNVARRTKEIGIRKILGATVPKLVFLLNRDFVRLVVIGNLLAWPLAYFVMNKWLENFAYRISISPGIFLLSSLLSLAVALLVVGAKTVKAALVNPSETLRYE
jgi:putative ABC transport system permease protein